MTLMIWVWNERTSAESLGHIEIRLLPHRKARTSAPPLFPSFSNLSPCFPCLSFQTPVLLPLRPQTSPSAPQFLLYLHFPSREALQAQIEHYSMIFESFESLCECATAIGRWTWLGGPLLLWIIALSVYSLSLSFLLPFSPSTSCSFLLYEIYARVAPF